MRDEMSWAASISYYLQMGKWENLKCTIKMLYICTVCESSYNLISMHWLNYLSKLLAARLDLTVFGLILVVSRHRTNLPSYKIRKMFKVHKNVFVEWMGTNRIIHILVKSIIYDVKIYGWFLHFRNLGLMANQFGRLMILGISTILWDASYLFYSLPYIGFKIRQTRESLVFCRNIKLSVRGYCTIFLTTENHNFSIQLLYNIFILFKINGTIKFFLLYSRSTMP